MHCFVVMDVILTWIVDQFSVQFSSWSVKSIHPSNTLKKSRISHDLRGLGEFNSELFLSTNLNKETKDNRYWIFSNFLVNFFPNALQPFCRALRQEEKNIFSHHCLSQSPFRGLKNRLQEFYRRWSFHLFVPSFLLEFNRTKSNWNVPLVSLETNRSILC